MTGGTDKEGHFRGNYAGSTLINPGIVNDALSRQV